MRRRLAILAALLVAASGATAQTLDVFSNFSRAQLTSGISSSATTLTVGPGDGARFPQPPYASGGFNAYIWDGLDYLTADSDPNREIVRVTNIVGDTLTIVRGQEGTTATTHNLYLRFYYIGASPTARYFNTDLPAYIAAQISATPCATCVTTNTTQTISGDKTFSGALNGNLTGNVSGNVTGNVTGNATSASALAADPSPCSTNQFVSDIAANGTLTCGQPSVLPATTETSVTVNGTGGNGYLEMQPQSSAPSTPSSGFRFFATSTGMFAWKGSNGFVRQFDGSGITADRAWTLPNISGSLALSLTPFVSSSGVCNGADATDDVVWTLPTISAGALGTDGATLTLVLEFLNGATANNKHWGVNLNGTCTTTCSGGTQVNTGNYTTSGGREHGFVTVQRINSTHVNVWVSSSVGGGVGASSINLLVNDLSSNALPISVTAASPTAGVQNDVCLYGGVPRF